MSSALGDSLKLSIHLGSGDTPELVPCSDMAGEIVSVGEAVKDNWSIGDRVCANFFLDKSHDEVSATILGTALGGGVDGVLAEYRVFHSHSLVRVPDHLSFEEASTLPCAALTAYTALLHGFEAPKAGDTVLIQGTALHSFVVASGATTIILSSSSEKLQTAAKLGAAHVINYKTTTNWAEEVAKLTNGRVVHVLEVVGNATLAQSIASLRLEGSVDIIGVLGGITDVPAVDVVLPGMFKQIKVRGVYVGSVSQFKAMNSLLAAHPETTRPIIDKVFAFEEAKKAFEYLGAAQHVGKVVVKVA